jgi:hypothetical protein
MKRVLRSPKTVEKVVTKEVPYKVVEYVNKVHTEIGVNVFILSGTILFYLIWIGVVICTAIESKMCIGDVLFSLAFPLPFFLGGLFTRVIKRVEIW